MRRSKYPVKRIVWLEKRQTSRGIARVRLVERDLPKDKEKVDGYLKLGYEIIKQKTFNSN